MGTTYVRAHLNKKIFHRLVDWFLKDQILHPALGDYEIVHDWKSLLTTIIKGCEGSFWVAPICWGFFYKVVFFEASPSFGGHFFRSSKIHQKSNTRWFKVTFSSGSWRSLNHWKGSLNHPKKVTLNHQVHTIPKNMRLFWQGFSTQTVWRGGRSCRTHKMSS